MSDFSASEIKTMLAADTKDAMDRKASANARQHPATTSDVAYRLDMIASELQGLPHVVETCREASARIAAMREGLENIAASVPMIRPARFPNTYKGGYDAASCWSSDVATQALGASPNPATTELSKNLGELEPATTTDDLVALLGGGG
jgi:hypothetical protein